MHAVFTHCTIFFKLLKSVHFFFCNIVLRVCHILYARCFYPQYNIFKTILKSVHFCFCKIVLEYATFYMYAVFTRCTIFLKLLNYCKVTATLYPQCITWVGLPHSFICTRQAVQNRSSAWTCSPCTSNCTHHTDIRAVPLAARRHSNFLDLHGLNAVHLFHCCLCIWSPSTVLFFPLSSPQWRHLSPTTLILYVHGRCGSFIH